MVTASSLWVNWRGRFRNDSPPGWAGGDGASMDPGTYTIPPRFRLPVEDEAFGAMKTALVETHLSLIIDHSVT